MIRKRGIIVAIILLAIGLMGYYSSNGDNYPVTVIYKRSPADSTKFLVIYQNNTKMYFATTRPNKYDTSIYVCIPAAFTTLDKYQIDGLYICDGKVGNKDKINRTLGGGIEIIKGKCTIFHTGYGKLLTDTLVDSIAKLKGSFFQQIWMIDNGKVADINETVVTYRRGIAIFKDGKTAIIESLRPMTLKTFANDLYAMDVMNLIYTDMGSWDEGWYRSSRNGKIVPTGSNHTQTSKQSNWVVFKR